MMLPSPAIAGPYTRYNYLQGGLVGYVKRLHFRAALVLASRAWRDASRAIDFGCGDGAFLPELNRTYSSVVAVETDHKSFDAADRVIRQMCLDNVRMAPSLMFARGAFHVAFCLEVLEHVTDPTEILDRLLFESLQPGGFVVISVPVMLGLPLLLQRIALWFMNGSRERLTWRQLARAVLLRDLSTIPHRGGHVGFDYRKLEATLRVRYHVTETMSLFFQRLWTIQR